MKWVELRFLFVVVTIVETFYALSCVFTPPSMMQSVLGWNLSADGQWIAKLLGLSLGLQAAVAWVLRKSPPPAIAWILALYQVGAATADWVMWWLMRNEGIFQIRSTQLTVAASIPTHYVLGVLLMIGAMRASLRSSKV